MLSRPSIDDVMEYRHATDARMMRALAHDSLEELSARTLLGLHHEMQHQELLLTDVKHALFQNPTLPAYRTKPHENRASEPLSFASHEGGLVEIGASDAAFSFDNERPRHRVFTEPFAIASRLVTCGEYLEFIRDRGYERPELWLADGFRFIREQNIRAPMYWIDRERIYTLNGVRAIDPNEPVCHVSYFEADAFARFAGARLPTEAEWEISAKCARGNFVEDDTLHPHGAGSMFGDAWQWTQSAYAPYPGFQPFSGPLGEYNGKFMAQQMVLRGGSCLSARAHIRASYRNFFPCNARWQMTGIRLAQ